MHEHEYAGNLEGNFIKNLKDEKRKFDFERADALL
jgi:hypothetical protein